MDFDIEGFAGHLVKLSIGGTVFTDAMLEWVGIKVEKAAKAKIGEYQPEAGQFIAWPDLAESTIHQKEHLGYFGQVSEDDPLLRTGEMRDSIEYTVGFQEVQIGSDDPNAEHQELGTDKIPPRSFLGGAAFEQTPKIVDRLGIAMASYLVGEKVFQGKLRIE